MRAIALLLLAGVAWAQELPSAPTVQPEPCTQNGKPCPKWLEKMVGTNPTTPPAPDVTQYHNVRMWTFRKHWTDPALRNPFKSRVFWGSQGLMFVSMVVACRTPKSGEDFHSELPWTAGVFGLSYLADRYLDELYAAGAASIVSQHYMRASIR